MAELMNLIYRQNGMGSGDFEVWVDTRTGVNYLVHKSSWGESMTVMVDRNGKPIVTK